MSLYEHPEQRAQIACLPPEAVPRFPLSVVGFVESVCKKRGLAHDLFALSKEPRYEKYRLERFRGRTLALLDEAEAVELGLFLALSHPNAALTVLYDPFRTGASVQSLHEELVQVRDRGGQLVVTAPSIESLDALRHLGFPADLLVLKNGYSMGAEFAEASGRTPSAAWVVETSDPRALLALLGQSPDIRRFHLDDAGAKRAVYVQGDDPRRVSAAVVQAALAGNVELYAMEPAAFPSQEPM
jgi:hypothetical protein